MSRYAAPCLQIKKREFFWFPDSVEVEAKQKAPKPKTDTASLTGAQVNLKGHGKGPGKNLTRKVLLKYKTVVTDGELSS